MGQAPFLPCALLPLRQPPSYSITFSPPSPFHLATSIYPLRSQKSSRISISALKSFHFTSQILYLDARRFTLSRSTTRRHRPFRVQKPHLFRNARDLHWLNGPSLLPSSPHRAVFKSHLRLFILYPTFYLRLGLKRYLDSSVEHCVNLQTPVWLVSFIW